MPDGVSECAQTGEARWYAVRTRPRHEKRVRAQLEGRQVEPFLPLVERWSQWKDRRKRVSFPLFPGYCFARFPLRERLLVLTAFGVVELVGVNGRPEPVQEREIEAIRRLVISTLPFDPHPYVTEGRRVEVIRGPLSGIQGIVLYKKPKARLVLTVDLIQQAVSVELDADDVAPL